MVLDSRSVFIVAFLCIGFFLLFSPKWTVDDAFISYRYAENLVEHGELNWNPGDAPVEGYTGILLPLIAAFFLKVGINVLFGTKILGVFALFAMLFWNDRSMKILGVTEISRSVVLLFSALSPLLYIHTFSGLETIYFVALISLCIYLFFKTIAGDSSVLISLLFGFVLALTGLCRPEGILLSILFLLFWFYFRHKQKQRNIASPLLSLLIFAGIITAWLVWRFDYYGYLLPNSAVAKAYDGIFNPESLKDILRFLLYYAFVPVLSLGFLWLMDADAVKRRLNSKLQLFRIEEFYILVLIGLVFLGATTLYYSQSSLYMNYASRFHLPLFPFILIGIGAMISMGIPNMLETRAKNPIRFRAMKWVLGIAIVLQVSIFGFKARSGNRFLKDYSAIVEEEYKALAKDLNEKLPKDATLIVYMDAGALPYYTALRTIDFGKINDLYLARAAKTREEVIDYFFSHLATAIVMTSEEIDRYSYIDEAHAIQQDVRFKEYELAKVYFTRRNAPYYQFLYLRKDRNK